MHLRARQTCANCGTRADEWDPKLGGDRRAYTAEVQVCRGCQAVAERQKGVSDEQAAQGHYVVLRRGGDGGQPA